MVTNHWIIHWEPDPPRTGSPNLSWLAFLNPTAEFSSRSISYGNWGFSSQQNVRAFRGIWYGIPLMYTPGVFPIKGQTVEKKSVQSSLRQALQVWIWHRTVRMCVSASYLGSNIRNGEMNCNHSSLGLLLFFLPWRGGVKNICSSTWEFYKL